MTIFSAFRKPSVARSDLRDGTWTKLIASLGFNLIARLPGVLTVLFILPLISKSLGTAAYASLLSAVAVGSVCTLPFGGINTVGRRLIASAYGAKDRTREAEAFVLTFLAAGAMTIPACAAAYVANAKPVFFWVSLMPITVMFLNIADSIRASYNEHYVTAILQFVFQASIIGAVLLVGVPKHGVLFSGLALHLPYVLASLATLALLVYQRPYLLSGKAHGLRAMLVPALSVTVADGSLMALLNLSVYWLGQAGNADYAAWYGTFVRLFQSFLSPVMLILLPLTSYIAIRWQDLSPDRQLHLHRTFMLGGVGYGAAVGLIMAVGGSYYIGHIFTIAAHGDTFDVAAITLFIAAFIALKTYSLLLYSVSDARRVSFGTAGVVLVGFSAAAATASIGLPPHRAVDALLATTGALLMLLLFAEGFFQRRNTV